MTVVDVALLPLYVTHKILYVGIFIHYTVCNGVDELLKTFWWHSGSWDYSLDGWIGDQLTNQGSWRSPVKMTSIGLVAFAIGQAFYWL